MTDRPSRRLLALETRAVPEFGAFAALAPAILGCLPRGDGHPVLVLPGFVASDASTLPIRWFLRRLGYRSYGWALGPNFGPTDRVLDGIAARIGMILDRHDQPLSIIGWSLGGLYAREFARLAPDDVRSVITLGSPFQMESPNETNASKVHEIMRSRYSDSVELPRLPDWTRDPMPVPATAIFSRTDGIVSWDDCIDTPTDSTENIEVYGSHCGLGHNPSALLVIGDRLSQSPNRWRRFVAPRPFQHLFPSTDGVQPPSMAA